MSKEHDLSNAIDAYLDKQAVDKSIMPLPKGHPMRPDRGITGSDIKETLRQAGEAIGIVKPKVPSTTIVGKPENRHGVPVIRGGPNDVTHEYQRGGAKDFRKPGGLNKAKPKVLKPGSPEHNRAMAEMEAIKAGKPKSRNPAGVESPSAAGSRDKLGERPLVEGIDKDFGAPPRKSLTQAERNAIPELGWDTGTQGHNPTKQNFRRCVGEDCKTGFKYEHGGPASKPLECPHCGKVQDRYLDKQDMKKSMDLEEPSRSWSYQG